MIDNTDIKNAILNDIINIKFACLIYISEFDKNGVTAMEISKRFNVCYSYVTNILTHFERKGYIITIPSVSKREKRRVLTEQTRVLFKIIGGL